MCRVKTGAQITNESDLQNLVTATILREEEPYSIRSLSQKINEECQGSPLNISLEKILKLVAETTDAFLRYEYLDCFGKKYFSKNTQVLR